MQLDLVDEFFLLSGVHTLLMSPTSVRYAVFSLASGRVEPGGTIPPEAAAALTSPNSGSPILYTGGMVSKSQSILYLRVNRFLLFAKWVGS